MVSSFKEPSWAPKERRGMKRVIVGHYGGPEVLQVVEEDDPRAGPGEVRVRVLAAGVSFSDALLRADTYLGGPKPPFTPGYELVGVVEELGPGCSRLREGDRVAALTVWGADAERVCVPEKYAVEVPEDLDPAEVVSLVLPYTTAYQLLHRVARVKSEETVLVQGAAGRVGTAVLELGALAGLRLYGTASARDRAAVEQLGAVAIDYQNEDFVARVRGLPGRGVDVVLDGLGGAMSIRSFRALRPGGRLVVFGYSSALTQGRRSRRAWIKWNAQTASVFLWACSRPAGGSTATGSTSCATATRSGSGRTSSRYSSCFAVARSTPSWPSVCHSPKYAARNCSRARRRR